MSMWIRPFLVTILTCVFFSGSLNAKEIQSLSDVMAMTKAAADTAVPVQVEATVHYCSPSLDCFVSDGDVCMLVDGLAEPVRPGDRVVVSGSTGWGRFGSVVHASSVKVTGQAELSEAKEVRFKDVVLAHQRFQWLTAEGVVEAIRVQPHHLILACMQDDTSFDIRVPNRMGLSQAAELVGARVRCTGNLLFNQSSPTSNQRPLMECSSDRLTVQAPSKQSLELGTPRGIHEIWNDDTVDSFRLRGQVTFRLPGSGFYVQQNGVGMWIHDTLNIQARPGEFVDIIGQRFEHGDVVKLNARVLVSLGEEPLPVLPVQSVASILEANPESLRVRLVGEVVDYEWSLDVGSIVIKEDEHLIHVCVLCSSSEFESLGLVDAGQIDVTGTLTFAISEDMPDVQFQLSVPSIRGIIVQQRTQLLSDSSLITLLALASFALVVCLGWGSKLYAEIRNRKRDLAQLSAQLQMSFDSIQDGIIVASFDNKLLHSNRKAFDYLGIDFSDGMQLGPLDDLFAGDDSLSEFSEAWHQLKNSESKDVVNFRLALESPHSRTFSVFTTPVRNSEDQAIARLWVFSDITEKESLQSQLLHAQKQEAIGQLAGGFAHDFNNLLMGVLGNLDAAQAKPESRVREVADYLESACSASERASTLVSQLLGFSRKTRLDLRPCDVNKIVTRIRSLVKPSLAANVRIRLELGNQMNLAKVDAIQLEQVILNMCLNSCDAMDGEGEILLKTEMVSGVGQGSADVKAKNQVVITVRDTGRGMAEHVRAKIFEPYFTTKEAKGTGLGLAMSEGIVHQHNGRIECESQCGVGTEFRICLPAVDSVSSSMIRPGETLEGQVSLNHINVLVVDDEQVVRQVLSDVIKAKGGQVTMVNSGQAALDILTHHTARFDVVILDWKMPGLSGGETLAEIKRVYGRLPVIVCTGFGFDAENLSASGASAPDAILEKPAGLRSIGRTIRQVTRSDSQQASSESSEAIAG